VARIRSIHPGLWTDEAFLSIDDAARLLYIGLLTEADDNGAFEWKPLTIKVRLRPATSETPADIASIMERLCAANMIRRYEHDGKSFGAVRNFVRYQRPKSPKSVHVIPEQVREFVGLNEDGSRPRAETGRPPTEDEEKPLPNSPETPTEIYPQRKEEGGSREEVEEERKEVAAQVAAAPKDDAPPAKRATRLPADWEPSPKNEQDALALGLPLLAQAIEARKFRDYWLGKSGRDATKVDWDATWRLWVTRACEQRGATKTVPSAEPVASVVWIHNEQPEWAALAARHQSEKGKLPPVLTLRTQAGPGNYFPADWLSAQPERTEA